MNHNPSKTWRTANFAGKATCYFLRLWRVWRRICPVLLAACTCMKCSFLFAAFIICLQCSFFVCSVLFYLQRFCYLQHTSFNCSASFFICSVLFLLAAFTFCLQHFFFVCSISFLFAAFLFCLQHFFFVCSVSFLFAACPLWAIVIMWTHVICQSFSFNDLFLADF